MKRPKSLLGNRDVEIPVREIEPGILIADKPKGISSFDVIRVLRKKLSQKNSSISLDSRRGKTDERGVLNNTTSEAVGTQNDEARKIGNFLKMGHAGTLDPNATGLMILAHGSATKRLSEFLKLPKTYEAEILFGIETDTGDTTGAITREEKDVTLHEKTLREALQKLIGTHILPVPAYSAIKMAGKSLYEHTLAGTLTVQPVKEMIVNRAEIISINSPHVSIRFDVESGTYIRSLAEEIGRSLNLPATLSNLRRTRVGKYSL